MTDHRIEPEVAGGLGPGSILDRSVHPPLVQRLEYELAGWLGDDLVEAFPCLLVTESLATVLVEAEITGFELDDVTMTLAPGAAEHLLRPLPSFRWLRITGRAHDDDLWVDESGTLLVGDRGLAALRSGRLEHAVVTPLPTGEDTGTSTPGPDAATRYQLRVYGDNQRVVPLGANVEGAVVVALSHGLTAQYGAVGRAVHVRGGASSIYVPASLPAGVLREAATTKVDAMLVAMQKAADAVMSGDGVVEVVTNDDAAAQFVESRMRELRLRAYVRMFPDGEQDG